MTDAAKAYAVRRAQRQNPDLKIDTWEDLLALPMNALGLDMFNELLDAGLVEIKQEHRDLFKSPPAGKPKKDPSMLKKGKK